MRKQLKLNPQRWSHTRHHTTLTSRSADSGTAVPSVRNQIYVHRVLDGVSLIPYVATKQLHIVYKIYTNTRRSQPITIVSTLAASITFANSVYCCVFKVMPASKQTHVDDSAIWMFLMVNISLNNAWILNCFQVAPHCTFALKHQRLPLLNLPTFNKRILPIRLSASTIMAKAKKVSYQHSMKTNTCKSALIASIFLTCLTSPSNVSRS